MKKKLIILTILMFLSGSGTLMAFLSTAEIAAMLPDDIDDCKIYSTYYHVLSKQADTGSKGSGVLTAAMSFFSPVAAAAGSAVMAFKVKQSSDSAKRMLKFYKRCLERKASKERDEIDEENNEEDEINKELEDLDLEG
jgi:hypothetical protein